MLDSIKWKELENLSRAQERILSDLICNLACDSLHAPSFTIQQTTNNVVINYNGQDWIIDLSPYNNIYTHPEYPPISLAGGTLSFVSKLESDETGHIVDAELTEIDLYDIVSEDLDVTGGELSVLAGVEISLKDILDSNTGTFVKINKNAKGLVTGSTPVIWSDLAALGAIKLTSLSSGTGISYDSLTGVITNTAPDKVVAFTEGAGIAITGTYPNFTISSLITQYTDSAARAAISLSVTGTSGNASYNNTTGILTIPGYTLAGLGGINLSSLLTSYTLGSNTILTTTDTIIGAFGKIQGQLNAKQNTITPGALTKVDDTNVTLTLGGTPSAALLQAASLTLGWAGQLSVARGGTGTASLTGVVIGTGTTALTGITGTTNQVLRKTTTGYEFYTLADESDPIFIASPAFGISATDITNWNTAYSNNHVPLSLGTNTNGLSLAGQTLSLSLATTLLPGAMSKDDKTKLDSLSNYTLPIATASVLGGVKIGTNINVDSNGVISVTFPASYILPIATDTILGGVKLISTTAQTVVSNALTSTASRTYSVQMNNNSQLVVNVPWTDTIYTHPNQTAINHTNTGATIISGLTVNTLGHTTALSTRTLTLSDLGYTAYVHPTGDGNLHVPATLTINNGKALIAGATAGSLSWGTPWTSLGYLTANQTITLSGDITGSGTTAITTTLATITDSGVGTFKKITVNSKGLVTGTVAVTQSDITALLGNASISNSMLVNSSITINGTAISLGSSTTVSANTTNPLILQFDSGTVENTDLYTFSGSNAKTINFIAGTNVSLTKAANSITISANDTSIDWSEITNKPSTFTPTTHTLDSHSNVVITSILTDQLLKWNGTSWINFTPNWTTNTGTVTSISAGAGLNFTTITGSGSIVLGTPTTITTSTTNSVSGTTHSHAITASLGLIGNGSAQNQILVTGTTPFTPVWTPATNLVSLNALSYSAPAFVKMTAAGTFTLDTTAYTTNTGTVTSVSITTANGISGTVATATTTPAISLSLAAITPTSVNGITFSGSGTPTLSVTGTSSISGSNTGDNAVNTLYSGLVSNATHTGDATGSVGLTVVGLRNVTLPTLTGASGFLRYTGSIWSFDTSTYLTANQTITLSGEVSGSGTTAITTILSNAAVISKLLTNFTSTTGTVSSTDTILQAIQKLDGNIALKQNTITGAALTKVDDTNITLTLGGSPTSALLTATSITVGWTGTLADSRIASASNWNTAFGWGNHVGLYSLLGHTHTLSQISDYSQAAVNYWNLSGSDVYRNTGKVLVGLSSPIGTATFQVTGDSLFTGNIELKGKLYVGNVESTTGVNLIEGKYSNGTLLNIGTLRASGGSYMSYALKADNTIGGGWLSSSGGALGRSAFVANGGYLSFWALGTTTVADGATISPTEIGRWYTTGLGVGTNNPINKLHVVDTNGILLAHTESANTSGGVRIYGRAYGSNRLTMLMYSTSQTTNILMYGGGTSGGEPATEHVFYTVEGVGTAQTGSARARLNVNGIWALYGKADDLTAIPYLSFNSLNGTRLGYVGIGSTGDNAMRIVADGAINAGIYFAPSSGTSKHRMFENGTFTINKTTDNTYATLQVEGNINQTSVLGSILRADSNGTFIAAIDGTDFISPTWISNNLASTNYWVKSGSNLYYNVGNVAIGGSDTSYGLLTTHKVGTGIVPHFVLNSGSATTGDGASIDFNGSSSYLGSAIPSVRLAMVREGSAASGYFAIYTRNSSSQLNEWFRITSAGNVGIGASNPQSAKLEVNGDIINSMASGGTLTLYDNLSTRSNRIILGANATGAFINSTYSSGGSGSISLQRVGTTVLMVNDSYRVLIGSSPVENGTGQLQVTATSGNIAARFTDSSATTEYVDIYRYGLQFSRSASYLRPASNDSQVLYVGYTESSQKWQLIRLDATTIAFNNHANISVLKTNASGYLQAATQADISGVLSDFYIKNQTTVQTANFNISGYGIIDTIKIHRNGVLNNTFIGAAGTGSGSTGTFNTVVGYNSLSASSSGAGNTVVGYASLLTNTTGAYNSTLGTLALTTNTIGDYNVAIGYATMYNSTTAGRNIAIGYYTARYLGNTASATTINGYNIAMGWTTMNGNSTDTTLNTGTYNIAIGYQALYLNESGSNNNVLGNGAGHDNKTGIYNVFLGTGSGYTSRASGYNTGVGTNTFRYYNDSEVVTQGYNVAVGYRALEGSATAANNTFTYTTAVGVSAGVALTSGSYNTFVGYSAGSSVTTGGYNILIGRNAGSSITTGIGNVVLGAHGGSQIATINNWMLFSDGNGTYRYQVSNNGRLIIKGTAGSDNGFGDLQVNGTIWTSSIAANSLVKTNADKTLVAVTSADITSLLGDSAYIKNQTSVQTSANFNIDGYGTASYFRASELGFYGKYQSSTLVQGIWSISPTFKINSAYTDFDTQYGLVYGYNNAGSGAASALPNGSTKNPITDWGHQIGLVHNGSLKQMFSLTNGYSWQLGIAYFGTWASSSYIHPTAASWLRYGLSLGQTGTNGFVNLRRASDGAEAGGIQFIDANNLQFLAWGGSGFLSFRTASTEKMRITSAGNVLINDLTGNTYKMYINSGTTSGDGLYINGKIFATDNIQSYSDRAKKSNIQDLILNNKLQKLQLQSYEINGHKSLGFIAQDVQPLFPELVGMENGFLTLDYNAIGALGLGLSIENKNEIETLKERIKVLEEEIERLK